MNLVGAYPISFFERSIPTNMSRWNARSTSPITLLTLLFTAKPNTIIFSLEIGGIAMIDLDSVDVVKTLDGYLKDRAPQKRDASWGFCFNFFQERRERGTLDDLLPVRTDHEVGCLQLASYLASWGMYRGSGPLLQRSAAQYGPVLEAIVAAEDDIWDLDADAFDKTWCAPILWRRNTGIEAAVPIGGQHAKKGIPA